MSTSPRLLRDGFLRQNRSICAQCFFKLSRPQRTQSRRNLSNTTPIRSSATAGKGFRHSLAKEYFWANGILEEVFGQSRRGLTNDAIRGQDAVARPSTSYTQAQEMDGALSQTTSQLATTSEELPHRRRKRLKEEANASASPSYPIAPDASSQLASVSSALPSTSYRRLFTTYLSLSKPRLTFLVMLTATGAYGIFPVPALLSTTATAAPSLSGLTLLFLTTGTTLASASANTLNMLLEPAHDAKMSRTRNRPLVRNLISPRNALLFAIVTGSLGVGALYYGVNPTVAFLGAANIVLYAGVYTPLKRMHVINTWVGALVGGIPPLMGWAAAAGQSATQGGGWQELLLGENSAGGWLLASLLFCWQFPHFNSLSWTIREEYKAAGYRMLAWVNPAMNARVALRYSILMFPICIGLSVVGVTDWAFVATSSAVNGWMLVEAVRFWRYEGQKGSARGLFWASVWHLPIVLLLAMMQKKGLMQRVWDGLTGRSGVPIDEEEEEMEYLEEADDDETLRERVAARSPSS